MGKKKDIGRTLAGKRVNSVTKFLSYGKKDKNASPEKRKSSSIVQDPSRQGTQAPGKLGGGHTLEKENHSRSMKKNH